MATERKTRFPVESATKLVFPFEGRNGQDALLCYENRDGGLNLVRRSDNAKLGVVNSSDAALEYLRRKQAEDRI